MQQKKTILMLSDHPLSTSGVGTQARYLVKGLSETNKYRFLCLGGAISHQDYSLVKVSDDVIIKPVDGFGTQEMIKHLLITEKPDALLLFTDPRFFQHVYAMEDEIHQICPIIQNHLWDEHPWPEFNKPIYECLDLINCINHPTYEFCKEWFPEKTNYIPHAVPEETFFKLKKEDNREFKRKIVGEKRENWFTVLYVGRNARRKMTSDILQSWKLFLDNLEQKEGHRNGILIMHTDPKDNEGPDLLSVVKLLKLENNIVFSNKLVDFKEMNNLYNTADVLINLSSNEGFGLPVLEAKMCEKPAIVIKTGGLTRQVEDHETGEQYGVAMEPDVKTMAGNQIIPYIFECFVNHNTAANALEKIYLMSKEERELLGSKAKKHAYKHYNMNDLIKSWDDSLTKLFTTWNKKDYKRWEKIEI